MTASAETERVKDTFRQVVEARDAAALRSLVNASPEARALLDAPLFPFDSPALVHVAGGGEAALPIVDALLDLGADPNRRSDWWAGPFHALHSARGPVAARLLEGGAVPDTCAAANLDDLDLLTRLLDEIPERVHERGGDGQTPLHFARSREAVDLLIGRGADVDARDVDHRSTPAEWMLGLPTRPNRNDIAEHLVERGASADVFMAAALGMTERLEALLTADPTLTALGTGRGEYGEKPPSSFHIYSWTLGQHLSPLQVAARFERRAALEVLLAFASPREHFLAACASADRDEARRLLSERPSLLAELDQDERRMLPDAAWNGETAAVELMLDLGFDVRALGGGGGTVLHCAAWRGAAAMVTAALRHPEVRALLDQEDPVHRSTPFGWCCHGSQFCRDPGADHARVAEMLLEAGARPGMAADEAPPGLREVIRRHVGPP